MPRKKSGPLSAKHRAAISRALRNKFGGRSKNKTKRNRRIAGALVGGGVTAAGLGLLYRNNRKAKDTNSPSTTTVETNNDVDNRLQVALIAPPPTNQQVPLNLVPTGRRPNNKKTRRNTDRTTKRLYQLQNDPVLSKEYNKLIEQQNKYRKAKSTDSNSRHSYKGQVTRKKKAVRARVNALRKTNNYQSKYTEQQLTTIMLFNDYSNIPGVVEFAARYQQTNELAEFARRKGSKDKKARKKKGMGLAAKAGLAAGAAAGAYAGKAALQARRARQGKKWGSAKSTLGVMKQDLGRVGSAAAQGARMARSGAGAAGNTVSQVAGEGKRRVGNAARGLQKAAYRRSGRVMV